MRTQNSKQQHRHKKMQTTTLQSWKEPTDRFFNSSLGETVVECGWGRLLFAQTFKSYERLIEELSNESRGERDLAFYVRDPHVVMSMAPAEVFLDPSHTFRIWFENYKVSKSPNRRVRIRRMNSNRDIEAANRILLSRGMIPLNPKKALAQRKSREVIFLLAEDAKTEDVIGFVTGVDHKMAFDDPENGSSLWSLAVSPTCNAPGAGEALVRYLIEYFIARGCTFMDLSVLHKNRQAIELYKKLNFERVPVFCMKLKNIVNEPLYATPGLKPRLNIYGQIIVDEAARRGIQVEILDEEEAYFRLTWGGKSVICRESLTEQTSAIAMGRCTSKRLTLQLFKQAQLKIPNQIHNPSIEKAEEFLKKYGRVVLKPTAGEQGRGVIVDITTKKELRSAFQDLLSDNFLIEEFIEGYDVRVIVINNEFIAAAVRQPPEIVGNGKDTVETLIKKLSRRRKAATQGESQVPIDRETIRCLKLEKVNLNTVLKDGESVQVRKTANLHTGGTIVDITNQISDEVKKASLSAAQALDMSVVGLDFILPELTGQEYRLIEANERPGLANHEPQPTAQKFIDYLFPLTRATHSSERH